MTGVRHISLLLVTLRGTNSLSGITKLAALIEQQLPAWGNHPLSSAERPDQRPAVYWQQHADPALDMLGTTGVRPAHIYTNRGASGIDGLIATAAGVR